MILDSAIVIGNGESRKPVDIQKLTGRIILVGCNAIHRDAIVNHLICVDNRMVEEAVTNINTSETSIYVRPSSYNLFHTVQKRKNILLVPPIPNQSTDRIDQPSNWGSGTYALLVTSQLPNIKKIYLLGFDLYGNANLVNNLYKDTKNYSAEGSHSIDPSYWIWQAAKVFKLFPTIEYSIVNHDNWLMPPEWKKSNVEFLSIENFKNQLHNS
jgi:hypothetical protein